MISRVNPAKFRYSDALTLAAIQYKAFGSHSPHGFGRLVAGSRHVNNDHEQDITHGLAQFYYNMIQTPGHDAFVGSSVGNEVKSFVIWKYPSYMIPKLEKSLARLDASAVSQTLREHPYYNWRVKSYASQHSQQHEQHATQLSLGELQNLDADNLAHVKYPQSLMAHCIMCCTDPMYQGQGLGTKLFRASLDAIPLISPFGNAPQKLNLWALTPQSVRFYQSSGFQPTSTATTEINGVAITSTDMVLTRAPTTSRS